MKGGGFQSALRRAGACGPGNIQRLAELARRFGDRDFYHGDLAVVCAAAARQKAGPQILMATTAIGAM